MSGLDIRLHARQGEAVMTPATEVLFGGAAGGGKSHLMRAAAIYWATSIPGLQIYLFRRLFPELKQNHLEGSKSLPTMLSPMVQSGRCRIIGGEIQFANGSRIFLRHCQYKKDIYSYQGAEIHVLLIDELTHWPEDMYQYLRGRCRMIGTKLPERFAGQFPRVLTGTNPGGVGHNWVKAGFVDNGTAIVQQAKEDGGMLRQFIPAQMTDNPSLLRDDPGYIDRLEGLGDPLLVKAMRDGDWEIAAGSMFGERWRRTRHTCEPFALPRGWEIWRGADDGFAMPAACYWLTQDPDIKTIYVIDEIYRAGMLPDEYGARIKAKDSGIRLIEHDGETGGNDESLIGIMDSGAWADTGHGQGGQKVPSRGDQLNAMGLRFRPAEKPPGSRIQRVQNLHRLLAPNPLDPQKRPGIIFFTNCPNAIRTIPNLPRDPKNIEDVDTDADDHCYDAVTYGLQRKRSSGGVVKVRGT